MRRTLLLCATIPLAWLGACSGGPEPTPPATGGQSSGGSDGSGGASGGAVGAGGLDSSGGGASTGGSGGLIGSGGLDGSGGEGEDIERLDDGSPLLFSHTGLYESDMVTLAAGVRPFEPRFGLWSDSASKKRWISLPEGTQIDTSDMNYWEFPAGTRVFKEFSRDGVRVETRMMTKRVQGGWQRVAYQWRNDQSEADAVQAGVTDASGTPHDIPSQEDCGTCHFRIPDKLLGFSAIQLAWDNPDPDAWTLERLVEAGKLTDLPPALELPGDETAQAALGYMHANCGHCHNPQSNVTSRVTVSFWLTAETLGSVEDTPTYRSTVCQDIELEEGSVPGVDLIIDPGSPDTSAAFRRVNSRGETFSMPPLGTELIDMTGRDAIEEWIESLSSVVCP